MILIKIITYKSRYFSIEHTKDTGSVKTRDLLELTRYAITVRALAISS